MLRKLIYFGSNKKSIPLLSPPGYRPTQIYAHRKRPFSGYKLWAYIRDFTVFFLILPETTECEFNNFNIGAINAIQKKFVWLHEIEMREQIKSSPLLTLLQ